MRTNFTDRELFTMGWIMGKLVQPLAAKKIKIGGLEASSMRPFTQMADAISKAHQFRAITPELDAEIRDAMCEITYAPDAEPEPVQPVPQQGVFQQGWYSGQSGEKLPDNFK